MRTSPLPLSASGTLVTRKLPTITLYKIGVKLDMTGTTAADAKSEVLEHERPERKPDMEAPVHFEKRLVARFGERLKTFNPPAPLIPHLQEKTIKAIAITTLERTPVLPDVSRQTAASIAHFVRTT